MHPPFRTLARFADGGLPAGRRGRVAAHLERCPRCRGRVADLRGLSSAARSLEAPAPAPDALERILARRAAGERVILPAAETPAPARRSLPRAAVAAGLVAAIAAGALLFRSPEAQAGDSALTILPEKPVAGAEVRVEFQPSSLLAGEDRLVLRARMRTADDQGYMRRPGVEVGRLEKEGGTFRGSFVLPDSVVFAALVVEDTAGTRVDTNGNRLWEVLAHGADGRPLLDAVLQKAEDLNGRNWELAYRTARWAAELYPDSVETWNVLRFYEGAVLGEEGKDSLRALHTEKFREFERRLAARPRLSGDDLASMMWYSAALEDSATTARWTARLLAQAPDHPLAVQEAAVAARIRLREDPAALVAEMDRMWDRLGPRHPWQAQAGLNAALEARDPAAVRRWADRHRVFRQWDAWWVAYEMTTFPELREEGMARLRAELARLDRGAERRLVLTVEEQRREDEVQRGRVLALLGKALLADGRTAAALDTLERAARTGWDAELFATIGEARSAAGDTAGALEVLARVAADPATPAARADSLARRAAAAGLARRWAGWVEAARGEMRARVLAEATTITPRGALRVEDDAGRVHELREALEGAPSVVVFVSGGCGPAIEALPRIAALRERVAADGARLVLLVEGRPTEETRQILRDAGITFPVYYDTRRDASRAFENWGTPQYYVLDARGRIRFDASSPDDAPRQLAALAEVEKASAGGGR